MKVIVFAASKGGVGKTTLLYNTAVFAAKTLDRSMRMADLDPQKSLKEIWTRSKELTNPRLVSNISIVGEGVKLLTSAGYDKEFLMVDTPGSLFPVISDALAAADLVVLPTKPMPIDLFAQEDVINIVEEMGLLDKALFVLTQAETRSGMIEKARDYLSLKAKHPIAIIPNRVEYSHAAETGGAACEENQQCKKEIERGSKCLRSVTPKTAMTAQKDQADVRKYH